MMSDGGVSNVRVHRRRMLFTGCPSRDRIGGRLLDRYLAATRSSC